MTKEELVKYIRTHDSYFDGISVESYSFHELTLIRNCIDAEKEIEKIKDSSVDVLSPRYKRMSFRELSLYSF